MHTPLCMHSMHLVFANFSRLRIIDSTVCCAHVNQRCIIAIILTLQHVLFSSATASTAMISSASVSWLTAGKMPSLPLCMGTGCPGA